MFLPVTTVTTGNGPAGVMMSSPSMNSNINAPIAEGAVRVSHDAASFVQGINWSSPTWDLFIGLFFAVTVFLYGVTLGRERVIVILVSIYMALATVTNAPYIRTVDKAVSVGQFFAFRALLFLGVFLLLFIMLSRSALGRTFAGIASGKLWQVMVFSAFQVGLLVSIVLSFLPADAVARLAPITREVFASDNGRFFWIVAPIALLAMVRPEESK